MRSIRYGLHFPLLVLAILLFWLAKDVRFPYWISNVNFFHYGLMGVLHAMTIVVSLRNRKASYPVLALCFIALAAVWSALTPFIALWGSILLGPILEAMPPAIPLIALIIGSVVGSTGYWLLVRVCWLKSLQRVDLLRTVAICAVATLLSFAATFVLFQQRDEMIASVILTAAWWFAFSISLYWSDMAGNIGN